jgi:hypothetical protein
MNNYWKELKVANIAGDGDLLSAPGANKRFVLVQAMASSPVTLFDGDDNSGAGPVLCHLAAGHSVWPAPLYMTTNTKLDTVKIGATAANVTVFYYIESMDNI